MDQPSGYFRISHSHVQLLRSSSYIKLTACSAGHKYFLIICKYLFSERNLYRFVNK